MLLSEILAEGLDQRLSDQGFSPEAVRRLSGNFLRVATSLHRHCSADTPVLAFFVPGRVEVLGKHTDYAGGSSLVCALERGFCIIAKAGQDRAFRVSDVASGENFDSVIQPDLLAPSGHWSNYVATVVRRVARNFPGDLLGGQLAFLSDLPKSAGMSSSSALVVGLFLTLRGLNNLSGHPAYRENIKCLEDLAHYLGCIENGQTSGSLMGDSGVGTLGGSEDHTAILCSKAGQIVHYSYSPIRFLGSLPVPNQHVFVLAVSGVTSSKTQEARALYNRISLTAARVVQIWRDASQGSHPHLAAILSDPNFSARQLAKSLRTASNAEFCFRDLRDRFEHFRRENQEIIPAAVEALQQSELEAFGSLVDQSQEIANSLLKNQVPETIFLARQARNLGAVAASAFGAGFGGSVWALVKEKEAPTFLNAWASCYHESFPTPAQDAAFFRAGAGPATLQIP